MNILRDLGCEEMQGYLFSRPVPGSEIKGLLTGMAWCPAELSQAECPSHLFLPELKLVETG